MALPKFLQSYLASYNLKSLDKNQDKELIITQILNKGDEKALHWLAKTYSQKEIKNVVSFPIRGMWMKSILSYWLRIFGIKLNKRVADKAVINLNKF